MDLTRDDDERSRMQSAGERGPSDDRGRQADHEEEVRYLAYERYVSRGGAPGSDVDDWLSAEREVRERRAVREPADRQGRQEGNAGAGETMGASIESGTMSAAGAGDVATPTNVAGAADASSATAAGSGTPAEAPAAKAKAPRKSRRTR